MTVKSFLDKLNLECDPKEVWMMENDKLVGILMKNDIRFKKYDYYRFGRRRIKSFSIQDYKIIIWL